MTVTAELLGSLGGIFADRMSVADAVREHHSHGESYHPPAPPDVVVYPKTTEEVSAIARLCSAHRTPMVPFGAGTSLEGHVSALAGGVCIDLSEMNRILRVSPEDLDATVEAGVTRKQLTEELKASGLTFFLDPGADASIGGMVATGASGTTAVRYGTIRDNVLGLTVVLATGEVIRTGGRARKSSAGYDLTRLMIGSEGTLGIVTEITLKLQPLPDAISAASCSFPTLAAAVDTVIAAIQLGIPVARAELLDERSMDALERFSKLGYPIQPTLFFEFHGASDASVAEQAQAMKEIAAEQGGGDFRWATTLEERTKLWHARHEMANASLMLRPGCKGWATDVCVPISKLAECIRETRIDNDSSPLIGPILGHVGDGNFHCIYLLDPARPEEIAEAKRLNDRLVDRALALGGTCTGEHGIGYGKMASLAKEHGDLVPVMRAIKRALDPDGLLNPGKIFPM
ncbi:MAG: FAD-linked oxidase C-terminal domain-containing protein [Gemmatimonadota bacterium]